MNKNKYFSTAGVVSYPLNPWIEGLKGMKIVGKVFGYTSSQFSLVNNTTGETSGDTAVISRKRIDGEEFLKLFEPLLIVFPQLSRSGIDLLICVLRILLETNTSKFSSDEIYINYSTVKNDYSYRRSNSVFVSARNELCKFEIIAPVKGKGNLYYLNPTMFFKGDRLKLKRKMVT